MRPLMNFSGEGVTCACCGAEFGSLVRVADGSEVCHHCLGSSYMMCAVCGQYFVRDEMVSDGYDWICEGCARM